MGTKIPEGYKLESYIDAKLIKSRRYKAWTVGDLREMLAEFPDTATVWASRYDVEADDIFIQPLETFSGARAGDNPHVIL